MTQPKRITAKHTGAGRKSRSQTTGGSSQRKNVFVVYGRNDEAQKAMFKFLRSLNLKPIEWGEMRALTRKPTPYIGEILQKGFEHAQAVVVVLTGDDYAFLQKAFCRPDDSAEERIGAPQPRPNVLFEAGVAFGMQENRTILVQLGPMRQFSDVAGKHILRFRGDAKDREELKQRLIDAGCAVSVKGKGWKSTGDFTSALDLMPKGKPQELLATVPGWKRSIPKLPLKQSVIRSIAAELERARLDAFNFLYLKVHSSKVQLKYIRANIFLPDYREVPGGYPCVLYLEDSLRKNMNYPQEWNLKLLPGEGVTGMVFVEGSQRVTSRREFRLAPEKAAIVAPNLKWIISMPLKNPKDQSTLAVMSLDGLKHEIPEDELSGLIAELEPRVRKIGAQLASQPSETIQISIVSSSSRN